METLVVVLIIAAAVAAMSKKFIGLLRGKQGCNGCGVASSCAAHHKQDGCSTPDFLQTRH